MEATIPASPQSPHSSNSGPSSAGVSPSATSTGATYTMSSAMTTTSAVSEAGGGLHSSLGRYEPPLPPSLQLPSGASVEVLTAQPDRGSTPHDEAELLADQDVDQLSKQLEKERSGNAAMTPSSL